MLTRVGLSLVANLPRIDHIAKQTNEILVLKRST